MSGLFYSTTILLIIIQCIGFTIGSLFFFKTKKVTHLFLALIFLMTIVEASFVEYFSLTNLTDNIQVFYLNSAWPRIIISTLTLLLELFLILVLYRKQPRLYYIFTIIPYLIFEIIMIRYDLIGWNMWFYFSARQFMRFILLAYMLFLHLTAKKDVEKHPQPDKFLVYVLLFALVNLMVLLEDTLTISQIQAFFGSAVPLQGRNFSEMILWVVLTAIYGHFIWPDLKVIVTGDIASTQETKITDQEKFKAFIDDFHLTPRETEVLQLLLENESPNDIADLLFISSGTLKTHLHNIYRKTDTTNRIELQKLVIESIQ